MANDSKYDYDIFISYNRADEAWAKQLATRLEQEIWQDRKLKVFFAPWDIKPGESIPERLEHALPRSRKVGLIMSPESVASEWVNVERYVTHFIDINERQKRLIPLYRRTCEIPPFLAHINYVDFRDEGKFEENYRILLATIKDEPLPRGEQITSAPAVSLPPAVPRRPAVGFIPRHDEHKRNILEQVKAELAPEKNQLVVLWGRGGAGKTILAAEAVREMSGIFLERIVWISALAHADLTLSTLLNEIAAQLGRPDLRPLAPEDKEEQVRVLIDAAPTLIVLDNFETIKPEEQKACVRFLAERAPCPALITTRSEINEDEVNNIPLEAMLLEEAQELLQRLIEHTRKPERFNALDRDDLIRKIEFNPLLLKWVVRQIDLAQRPETALSYLAKGDDEIAERIFDRSFNLERVGNDGRDALLALSLFVPDASREALAEASGFDNNLLRLDKAVENLSAVWLIDTTKDGNRLIIQGLTYERAKARLSKDIRAAEFIQRFVTHFLNYAQAHAQPKPEDFNALELEKDNVLRAMDEASSLANWAVVIQLMNAISFDGVNGFLMIRGYWEEAIRRGEYTLQAARNLSDEGEIAKFAHNLAIAYQMRGELAKSRQLYEDSLVISKSLDDQSGIATTLHSLAMLAQDQGKLTEAQRLYDESLEINKRLNDQRGIANTLHELGLLAQEQGKMDEARQLYNESLEINQRLSNKSSIASTTSQIGIILFEQGEVVESQAYHEKSLAIRRSLGEQQGIAIDLHQLGRLAETKGDRAKAADFFREALSIFEKLGSPYAEIARESLERVEDESS